MGALEGFRSTWSMTRETFGQGDPKTGEGFDESTPLSQLQTTVESAAPGSRWTGTAAGTYEQANTDHGNVFQQLAGLDRRLGAQVTQSAQVVEQGRRNLETIRQWVESAAASVPEGKNRDALLMNIVQQGLGRLTEIVTKSNGDLATIGGQIRTIGTEYQALGGQKFGDGGIQALGDFAPGETEAPRSPVTPGRPAGPTDPFVGNTQFGQWETVPLPPTGPYTPLKPEYRPYLDGTPLKVGASTGMYAPGKTWANDQDAPIVQYREAYKFRIAGTEATDITRTVNVNGEPQVQRWVANVYEFQRNTSLVPGNDLGGAFPVQKIDNTWEPMSLPEIAVLSANNAGQTYYLPDGCGGTVNFYGGVPASTGSPETPTMHRPR